MSVAVADKSSGPYKQFFACECGSRFSNEEELKIHFCLSHNGEKEVKVRVQRVYQKLQSPKQTKNEPKTPAILPAQSKISPIKIKKVTPNKNQTKIVSVQEDNPKIQIVRHVIPKKEEKSGYRKVYEELSQFAKRNVPMRQGGVTLYKSEPHEPNMVHSHTNVVQKKNVMKPIVIPISQMKPNSYVIQQPVKKQPSDKIQHEPQTQYEQKKEEQTTYQGYVLVEGDTQEYTEEEEEVEYEDEVGYEQEEYLSEYITEEYMSRDSESSDDTDGEIKDEEDYDNHGDGEIKDEEDNDNHGEGEIKDEEDYDNHGEEGEVKEEEADYENLLEAHEVETSVTEEKPPRKKPKKYKHKPAKEGDIFPCTICDRAFKKPMSLTQHLIQTHRPITRREPRAPTYRPFKKRKVEENKQDIKCDMCDREFFGNRALTLHRVKAHLGTEHIDRPVQCEHCEKSFRNRTCLNYHMRTHTGEKPYKCTSCPKAFTMKQGLDWHERTHTGERPEICRKCNKSFKWQPALIRHQKVHTGEKPYACPHCQKCFSQSNSMKLHILTVHMKQPAPYKSRRRKEKELQILNGAAMKKEETNEEEMNEEETNEEEMNEDETNEEEMNEDETNEEETNEVETKMEEMEVYFGSEDDAAGYEEVYA